MDLSGLNTTLGRIRQIENKIRLTDQNFSRLLNAYGNSGSNSFNNILDKKINELNPPEVSKNDKQDVVDKKNISRLIKKYANKNGLNKKLVNAVVKVESNFNNKAISSAGAKGLMQLMPLTAQKLGVSDPFDPEQNISGGTKYLSNLISKYNSVKLGLAAYNAGSENVNKYGGVPPYNETQNYVKKILELQGNQQNTEPGG